MAFKRNKSLRDIIWSKKVFDNKKILSVKKFNKGKYQPCLTRSINVYCNQIKTCSTFESAFNKKTLVIRDNKRNCVIYVMECCRCKKSQYVGKSEYSLRINTHRIKTPENQRFSSVFRGYKMGTLARNGLIITYYQSRNFGAC